VVLLCPLGYKPPCASNSWVIVSATLYDQNINMKKTLALAIAVGVGTSVQVATAGDISGTITLKGTPPPEKAITPLKDDPNCGKLHTDTPTTHHYVVGSKGELANVFVTIKGPGIGGKSGADAPPVSLDQKGCEYVPHILAMQTGQKLVAKNSDPVAHNVHVSPIVPGNKEDNKMQVPNGPDLTFSFEKPELFLKVLCNVHTWMFAYICVTDDPHYGLTDKEGKFTIKNVPDGKYTLEVYHRKATGNTPVTKEIEVKGGNVTQDFTLDAK